MTTWFRLLVSRTSPAGAESLAFLEMPPFSKSKPHGVSWLQGAWGRSLDFCIATDRIQTALNFGDRHQSVFAGASISFIDSSHVGRDTSRASRTISASTSSWQRRWSSTVSEAARRFSELGKRHLSTLASIQRHHLMLSAYLFHIGANSFHGVTGFLLIPPENGWAWVKDPKMAWNGRVSESLLGSWLWDVKISATTAVTPCWIYFCWLFPPRKLPPRTNGTKLQKPNWLPGASSTISLKARAQKSLLRRGSRPT